jgi:putative heme-binding domain-containing protein
MRSACLLALAVCAAQAQSRTPRDGRENPAARTPEAIAAGQRTFSNSCGACHGATGEGGRGPNLRDGKVVRKLTDGALFASIRKGVPGTEMPGSSLPDTQVWELVAYVRAMGAPASEMTLPGDARAGADIFYHKGGCVKCHSISGHGGTLGPDLTNIGAMRPEGHLRESVLQPNERLAPGFQPAMAIFHDGREVRGVVRNYSNYSVQFQDTAGELYLLDTAALKDLRLERASPMPSDYGKRLTAAEITDLVAFLARQAVRPGYRPERASARPGR